MEPTLEHKLVPYHLKEVDTEARTVEGYAAVFGNLDEQNDIIEPGAFKKTLANASDDVQVLLGHEWRKLPVGLPATMTEDEHGLHTVTTMFDTADGRDVVEVAKRLGEAKGRARLGMSIGYVPVEVEVEELDGEEVRHLKAVHLYEYSFVGMPANPLARVTGVKAGALAVLESLAREATDDEVLALLKQVRDGLQEAGPDVTARLRVVETYAPQYARV